MAASDQEAQAPESGAIDPEEVDEISEQAADSAGVESSTSGGSAQADIIRAELNKAIDAGKDLTDKDTKIAVCHDIEARLGIPYGNISKQVKKVLRQRREAKGDTASAGGSYTRNTGSKSSVTVNLPAASAAEPVPEAAPAGQPAAPQQQGAIQPAQPNLSDIYRQASSLEELRRTPEYNFIKLNIELGLGQILGLYQKLGWETPDPQQIEQIKDAWCVMCMKYNWKIDERIEKLVLIGGTVLVLAMPPLAHFGLLDPTGKNKKQKEGEPKKSDKPL